MGTSISKFFYRNGSFTVPNTAWYSSRQLSQTAHTGMQVCTEWPGLLCQTQWILQNTKDTRIQLTLFRSSWYFQWMQQLWGTNKDCYVGRHKLQPESICSILIYLSEVRLQIVLHVKLQTAAYLMTHEKTRSSHTLSSKLHFCSFSLTFPLTKI